MSDTITVTRPLKAYVLYRTRFLDDGWVEYVEQTIDAATHKSIGPERIISRTRVEDLRG